MTFLMGKEEILGFGFFSAETSVHCSTDDAVATFLKAKQVVLLLCGIIFDTKYTGLIVPH